MPTYITKASAPNGQIGLAGQAYTTTQVSKIPASPGAKVPRKIWVKDDHVQGGGYWKTIKTLRQQQNEVMNLKKVTGGLVGDMISRAFISPVWSPDFKHHMVRTVGIPIVGGIIGSQVAKRTIGKKVPKTEEEVESQKKKIKIANTGLAGLMIVDTLHQVYGSAKAMNKLCKGIDTPLVRPPSHQIVRGAVRAIYNAPEAVSRAAKATSREVKQTILHGGPLNYARHLIAENRMAKKMVQDAVKISKLRPDMDITGRVAMEAGRQLMGGI